MSIVNPFQHGKMITGDRDLRTVYVYPLYNRILAVGLNYLQAIWMC